MELIIIEEKIAISLQRLIDKETSNKKLKYLLESFIDYKEPTDYVFGTLCVIHYKDYTKDFNEEIYNIGAAIELIILSFDIVDDLQDNDTDYIWMKTPKLSLNAALIMITLASKIIRESSFKYRELALQIMDLYTLKSINGQHLDLLNDCQDESSYLQMITQKSGSLTAMSCLIGFILAQGRLSSVIEEYGTALGVIHQIKNDIQDLKVWSSKNDLLNRKYSLPIIYMFSLQNDLSKNLDSYYNRDGIIELLGDNISDVIEKSGSITYALTIKNIYKYSAFEFIDKSNLSLKNKNFIKKLMK